MIQAPFRLVALLSLLGGTCAAKAQVAARSLPPVTPADSSKVYTYVAQMPVYPGGMAALMADLRREFQAASAATGCAAPAFPVFVRLLVGPSGYVYAARSLNAEEAEKRRQSPATNAANLPELPAACEAAIGTAAHRLRRLQPGRQRGKPLTVELLVKLLEGNK